ncbi:hypothetical protein [Natrarchaeobaculum aegyptiacum]|uniref:Uncharacterized protein n=1 Tax=Natrarchaeobaculum aegyptiacum TaxID=745377 RepID=A0A2Z2HZ90_9EURY|nr:hypothetical protein [Natrarchaeobaculum aegyptiacum]ARS91785.1 hypothetical protein B1756_09950 [Natrarchaeobaculum aegyptiacum]
MTDPTLEDVERRLDRVTDLEEEAAVSVLRGLREDLQALGNDPDVDEQTRQELETQLDQHVRAVTEREAYEGELGAAMNPEDEDAP